VASVANFPLCRSLSAVALAKADVFVAEKTAQIFKYFRIFHTLFRIFSNVFEYFQAFSNVFERFFLAYLAQTLQLVKSTPVFNPKTNVSPEK